MEEIRTEGEWKDYILRFVRLSDIPKILEFITEQGGDPLHDVAPADAPIDEAYITFSNNRIAKLMESRKEVCELSLIAIHKQTGDIAGIHLQFIWEKKEAFHPPTNTDEKIPPFRKILNILHARFNDTKLGMFRKYDVEQVVWNFMVMVNSKCRNEGLASEMYKRIVLLLKTMNYPLAFSMFTSPYSRRCAQKEGFIEVDRVYFNELRNEEGELVLPKVGSDGFASIMVLRM